VSIADETGSEGKTDLSANPDGQDAAAPKDEEKKSGGFCACFSKKK
jgi:hypothetical protein